LWGNDRDTGPCMSSQHGKATLRRKQVSKRGVENRRSRRGSRKPFDRAPHPISGHCKAFGARRGIRLSFESTGGSEFTTSSSFSRIPSLCLSRSYSRFQVYLKAFAGCWPAPMSRIHPNRLPGIADAHPHIRVSVISQDQNSPIHPRTSHHTNYSTL
jgi:hypothetical protein